MALSDEQFKRLVQQRLDRLKIPAGQAAELLGRITDGSLQRLVFLVRAEDNPSVRFDISSLQEFMAAEALMTGPDEAVRDRLEVISPASFWRNVFLFAVGKCFVDREHMLDNIVSICERLNEDISASKIIGDDLAGQAAKAALWGARLALEILSDGTARQYPEYEIRLIRLALLLTKSGDREVCARLASVYHPDLHTIYKEVVDDGIGQSQFWRQAGAWQLIMNLADRDVKWVYEYLDRLWPADVQHQQHLIFSGKMATRKEWWLKKAVGLAPKTEPWVVFHHLTEWQRVNERSFPEPWGKIAENTFSNVRALEITYRGSLLSTAPRLQLIPAELGSENRKLFEKIKFENPAWFPLIAGARFGEHPDSKTLASELRWLSKRWLPSQPLLWQNIMPWPLQACVMSAKTTDDLNQMANMAADGNFGNINEWKKAEARWINETLTDEDVLSMSDDRWPIDSRLSKVGFPFAAIGYPSIGRALRSDPAKQLARLKEFPRGRMHSWIARNIVWWLSHEVRFFEDRAYYLNAWREFSPTDLREILDSARQIIEPRWITLDGILENSAVNGMTSEWVDFLNWLGQQDYDFHFYEPNAVIEEIVHHFCADPVTKRGLLPILTAAAVSGAKCFLSRTSLEVARSWGGSAKEDALLLAFAREDLTNQELKAISGQVAGESEFLDHAIWRAMAIASKVSFTRGTAVALEILRTVSLDSEDRLAALQATRERVIEYLNKLPSNLQKTAVWESLKLPPRLG